MNGLIGRKLGMTQVFDELGAAVPVTVIEAGPCPVVQVKSGSAGGHVAQLGFGARKATRATKALAGHAQRAGLDTVPRVVRDFAVPEGTAAPEPGAAVTVEIFAAGDRVKISGTTKGRGFQGVVKRYGFHGGPASHGNTRHRKPGSMGPGTDPSRVIKGKKLPGQYGNVRHTELNLRVIKVDPERHLLYVRGAVPGPMQSIVIVRKQGGRGRYA
ncbi:MAG TPA: 50S ribosomal protein L3 [Gemmatimonadales bacterium]|jgi:large subunit ribosomal protein L3